MSAVRLEHATLSRGSRQVLSDVSLDIAAGEFVGMLGPNGSGKTTLMRAVLGLLPLDSGRIEVLGAPPRRGNPRIGYVPQFRRIPPAIAITGEDLLLGAQRGERWGFPWPAADDRRMVHQALDRVGALPLAQRPLSQLSGGERQRLYIAQALVGSPDLLLLDEPLISLDPPGQRAIVSLALDVAHELGIAVLFSAHELNPLLGAVDRVLYLGGGHAALGTVDEVVRSDVLSALYGSAVRVIRADGHIFVHAEAVAVDGHHAHDHHEHAHG